MKSEKQTRRGFLGAVAAASALAAGSQVNGQESAPQVRDSAVPALKSSFTTNGREVNIYSSLVSEPVTILQISDSHLFLDDERGEEFRQYSDRMSHAYNHTKRFSDGKDTTPMEMLAEIAENAKNQNLDAIALTGDIVSFPSSAGVDYAKKQLDSTGVPWYYVCGNHDWHFEGMEGAEKDLRDEWIEKKLKPMYREGVDPLMYAVDVKGVKLLMIDDSIYEILPKQLEFIRKELADGKPALVFMHIPLYAPGRGVGFGVGHPDWNAEHDQQLYKIERRRQWPVEGHTPTTYAFRDELLKAPNLLGVFTGHIHSHWLDVLNGKPSHVTRAAFDGSTVVIKVMPYPNKNA